MTGKKDIQRFRRVIERVYREAGIVYADFGEILCYEIHSNPICPRLPSGTGFTFKELAAKWGITTTFLGELIADHCKRL